MTALRRAAREGEPLSLTDGSQHLDLVHVRDIARVFELAAERLRSGHVSAHESYAVRSGAACSVREVVERFGQVAGKPLAAEWGARPYRAREMMRPWAGGETLPGWRSEIRLEDGIRDLLGEETTGDP